MRWAWALVILGALLTASSARADPALSSPGAGQGLATWTFSNAADYTTLDTTVTGAGASLAWYASAFADSSLSDFSSASSLTNVDLLASPGDVRIANTSQQGPIQSLWFQPGPSAVADNYLYKGNGGAPNFGTSEELKAGNWGGGEWTRAVLRFPAPVLPSNATVVGAILELYFYDVIVSAPMDLSVHRMTTPWTELGSNWDTRDGVTLWNTTGGDFDAVAADTVSGVGASPGWYEWNITTLATAWWSGTLVNEGVMVRQVADNTTVLGEKGFYSSDAANASLRPRIRIDYTTPESHGLLVSRAFDAVGTAVWEKLWWNATIPSGASLAVRTRSGDTFPADNSWSHWSSVFTVPGTTITSPPARYLEYELDLATPTATSPAVHDVTVGYGHYAVAGKVTMRPFEPSGLLGWGRITINATAPSGTTVSLEISQDAGASWLPIDGNDLSSALVAAIVLRIDLVTTDTTTAPAVRSVSLAYRMTTAGPSGSAFDGIPWWILLALPFALGGWLVYRRRAGRPYRPEALYLIHEDGKLIARAGRSGMRDELASSAMLTLVLRFVKDSFGGPRGTGGELRDFTVDENAVVIARGTYLFMALVGPGVPRPGLSGRMNEFLARVETAYGARLKAWDGLREGLEGLDGDLAWFLEKGHRQPHPDRMGRSQA